MKDVVQRKRIWTGTTLQRVARRDVDTQLELAHSGRLWSRDIGKSEPFDRPVHFESVDE